VSKHIIDEKFFDRWKPEMAYVLGYLYADGSMGDSYLIRAKYITVTSIDKDRIELFKKLMKSEHNIKIKLPQIKTRQISYSLRIGSHKLYRKLLELGLYPNKSLTIKFPSIPKSMLSHFIRGYFDGDGCVYLEKAFGRKKQLILKRLMVVFTSGSKNFLEGLGKSLSTITKRDFKIWASHRSYQLRYNTTDTMKLFEFMYNNVQGSLFTRRKYNKFKEYLSLRPERLTNKAEVILKKHK
jgi:hypothetical protein